jgi:hypothetical protein
MIRNGKINRASPPTTTSHTGEGGRGRKSVFGEREIKSCLYKVLFRKHHSSNQLKTRKNVRELDAIVVCESY